MMAFPTRTVEAVSRTAKYILRAPGGKVVYYDTIDPPPYRLIKPEVLFLKRYQTLL